MPAKKASSKPKTSRAKSNVARPSTKTGLINKKVKFNWKIVAVIGIILVVALGYLYVRLSQAGGYTWKPSQFAWHSGKMVKKSDGRPAVESTNNNPGQYLQVEVRSFVSNDDTYCFSGKASKPIRYVIYTSYWHKLMQGGMGGGPAFSWRDSRIAPAGNFLLCQRVPGAPKSKSGYQRSVLISIQSDGVFAVYQVGRRGY